MATTIVNPSGSVPGMSQIDQAFNSIYSMFGSKPSSSVMGQPISGGFGGAFGVPQNTTPQPDQIFSSLTNIAGTTAPALLATGGGLVGAGTGVTGGGLDMSGTGFGTTQNALATLQPSIDFYSQLLAGNPTATTEALSPAATTLANVESGALTQAGQGMPAGGYRAATMAGLPQAEASQVGNAALNLIPTAAQQLAAAANEQAGIGATQAQIGQGVSTTGQQIAQTGTTLLGQGQQTMQNLIADALNKMGINYQYGGPQTFATIFGAL